MATLLDRFALFINRRFTDAVARDPAALRFYLNNSADAESNGESTIFDRVQPFLDGQIAKLVQRHADDEVRHSKMFTDALASVGGVREDVPAELRIVERLGKAAGDVFDKELTGGYDVARAYLILYAVERRAVERFTLMEEALAPLYPEISEVFARVKKDERAHLHYCVAVSKNALPDQAAWEKLRDEMIQLEAEQFTQQSGLFMDHLLSKVFTTMPWYEKAFFRAARAFNDSRNGVQHILDIGGAREILDGTRVRVAMAAA